MRSSFQSCPTHRTTPMHTIPRDLKVSPPPETNRNPHLPDPQLTERFYHYLRQVTGRFEEFTGDTLRFDPEITSYDRLRNIVEDRVRRGAPVGQLAARFGIPEAPMPPPPAQNMPNESEFFKICGKLKMLILFPFHNSLENSKVFTFSNTRKLGAEPKNNRISSESCSWAEKGAAYRLGLWWPGFFLLAGQTSEEELSNSNFKFFNVCSDWYVPIGCCISVRASSSFFSPGALQKYKVF